MADYDAVVSIVTYKDNDSMFGKCIDSVLNANIRSKLYIVDNSLTDRIKNVCCGIKIDYVFNNTNIGFGAGHKVELTLMLISRLRFGLTSISI